MSEGLAYEAVIPLDTASFPIQCALSDSYNLSGEVTWGLF